MRATLLLVLALALPGVALVAGPAAADGPICASPQAQVNDACTLLGETLPLCYPLVTLDCYGLP